MRSLRRAGWGTLAGREWGGVRDVLDALAASLPDRSAEGFVTMPQLAQRASLSERWVRRCMGLLEDAGLVRWSRGGIDPRTGKPVPSLVRLVKSALVDLIRAARPLREAADLARRSAMRERLGNARALRLPDRYRRRSAHAALSAALHTPKGGEAAPAALIAQEGDNDMRPVIPITCRHDGDAGLLRDGRPRCPMCRAEKDRERAVVEAAQRVVDHAMRASGDDTLWTD